ncbi:MAG: glycosyltransferase family 4 protein [Anaerolineales bacterium]|nr:glycosyltransferase family 4 protein [Anaerolineales bacterium]
MTKKLRIGISARGLNSHASGPNEYILGLSGALVRRFSEKHELFFYYNTPQLLGTFPKTQEVIIHGDNALLWDHVLLPQALKKDQIDLIIFPKGTISLFCAPRVANIILDLGYFYPKLNAYKWGNTIYTKLAMRYAAKKAWLTFTISEFTRQDVIRILHTPPERTFNIYGAAAGRYSRLANDPSLAEVAKKYRLAKPFIFYPTSLSPRKNFPRVLEAFEKVKDKIPHHLYFTGNVGWNMRGLEKQLARLSERVHRLGAVPVDDMSALYSLAEFAIYPSLFEGLGLPILEAFQCGTPLLASNQSSIPEVAGTAALIVDAYSIDALAEGLVRMATDASLRNNLARLGYERAKLFTWEKTAQTLMEAVETRW